MNAQETGKMIRNRRRLLGIDQNTVAELSGVSVHTISDIEMVKGNPSVNVLSRILNVLGLEMRIGIRGLASTTKEPNLRDTNMENHAER